MEQSKLNRKGFGVANGKTVEYINGGGKKADLILFYITHFEDKFLHFSAELLINIHSNTTIADSIVSLFNGTLFL